MILVTLGTQDKYFTRLLEAVDDLCKKGIIKDEVVVQAGQTKYESKYMKIFESIPKDEFMDLLDKCDLIITHGGVGSIFDGLNRNKKVIAAPRLSKYQEHHNDHQLQVVGELEKMGCILAYYDGDNLGDIYKKVNKFKPNKYESNNKNMIDLITNYIDNNHGRGLFRLRRK